MGPLEFVNLGAAADGAGEREREVAAEMLAALGYQPVTALGGEEALRLCREAVEPFDAAILDLAMPGMDGRECFRELKKIAPNLRTILSSGYGPDGTTCPPVAKHLIMMLVSHLYENRQPAVAGGVQTVPYTFDTLLAASGLGTHYR